MIKKQVNPIRSCSLAG